MAKKFSLKENNLSHERLTGVLSYCEESGQFFWLETLGAAGLKGNRAGRMAPVGYRHIGIDGHKYAEHRLAWFFVHKRWPSSLIDHCDMDKSNNRISNLREATHSTNKANCCAPANNTSGSKGVRKGKGPCTWKATITVNGEPINLGTFPTKEGARDAYAKAATEYYGEFARS